MRVQLGSAGDLKIWRMIPVGFSPYKRLITFVNMIMVTRQLISDDYAAGSAGELNIRRIHLARFGLDQGERLLFLHRRPPSIGRSFWKYWGGWNNNLTIIIWFATRSLKGPRSKVTLTLSLVHHTAPVLQNQKWPAGHSLSSFSVSDFTEARHTLLFPLKFWNFGRTSLTRSFRQVDKSFRGTVACVGNPLLREEQVWLWIINYKF